MDPLENWKEVKAVFRESFKSSFHYSIATVGENGEPHVTPIGSLVLGRAGHGFYFEKFASNLPRHLSSNNQVCVMAVNSGKWFWLKSLVAGRFYSPPAMRLYGEVGELREASEAELLLWQKRVKSVRFTKGHKLIWRDMSKVRDIRFTRVEAVKIGQMTRGLS